jgi:DegV family protein with EDD domain
MKIAISAESTIDLSPEQLAKYHFHTLHFHTQMGTEEGFDDKWTTQELFDFTDKTGTMCHTSACNIGELEQHFAKLLAEYDYIIHFTISSGLSSGFNNASAVAEGNPRIAVIDSHATSGGIAIQAIYAEQMVEAGYSFEEIVAAIDERRPFVQCSFQLDRLDYLYKGGRCTKLAMFAANLLRLKPEILCDANGKFAVGKKFHGTTEKCILSYIDDMFKTHPNLDKKIVFLDYSTMADPKILDECVTRCRKEGFQEVILRQASPTNAYHSGPNVIGVHFYYDGPHPIVPKA